MTSPIASTPTLVCFHHAGGGASAFSPWRRARPGLPIHPVTLPGREDRRGEPLPQRMDALVDLLADELADVLAGPHVLFGHSMGALMAYRIAVHRHRAGRRPAEALVVAASPPPHVATPLASTLDADDAELGASLARIGGVPRELLARPEWLSAFLVTVRADLRLCADHSRLDEPPLSCAIHAFGGTADPLLDRSAMAGWRRHTSVSFTLTMLPGGHFLVQDPDSGLSSGVFAIVESIARQAARPPIPDQLSRSAGEGGWSIWRR